MVKHLSTMRETQLLSLGWEDPLEKEMAIHSRTIAENPMDRGSWQATVHGVAKSRTQLSDFTFTLIGGLQIILEYGEEKVSWTYLLIPSLTFSELESTRNIVKLAEATRTNIGLQVGGQ